ncbi:putative F-box domain, galactose oxidase/kelch, beta-propeller, F-box associated interaction [Rosa chinensis]|uniref:Putative F-box domain, galactose oxidase/kelch, beta-propeller, F-box associated interaction n=1 Tax=Rosa chinensis TaxID=74649 RepID=A0A2P6RP26_ROSCH|nr:F-box protein CPR1 [Rosa chinensis]XP_040370365.1 F-box protein CPR1 [Rosa chinensis]XP_040370366.1 F-box protein CPR1 [Rosa chinensis]PRQ48183.1 putative F-box domain, galactose oxidase/kelch, beta-propeller, F-box associated interaction [Rosa chinensis]
MAETEELPEEIIVNILTWLPLKSLIRFTSVSKRLHSIILSDPKFAQSQLKAARQQKTLSRRLLVSTDYFPYNCGPQFESLRLDHTSSFGDPSSVTKLSLPFPPPRFCHIKLLGSCNGLVFLVIFSFGEKLFYIWNPAIGLFKQLPDPGFPCTGSLPPVTASFYGVGYLSATDDYKVLAACRDGFHETEKEVRIFSVRTHLWESIESLSDVRLGSRGTLSNNALHWLNHQNEHEMVSFDLAVQEFRRMALPTFDHDGESLSRLGVYGGCLCVSRIPEGACDSIDLWVMKEYDVCDSWSMLFSLKLSHPLELHCFHSYIAEFLIVESSTVAASVSGPGITLINIDHNGDDKLGQYMVEGHVISMIEYEESLLWIGGYHPVEEKEQVQILEIHQKASQS